MHYNSAGVKPSFIRDRDLIGGSLSIWRLHNNTDADQDEVVEILSQAAPPKNRLWDVFSSTAEAIRLIKTVSRPLDQALHVFDDTRTDTNGGTHPKHAAISICEDFDPAQMTKDAGLYVEIRDALVLQLRKNAIWKLPADERA